jgi:hypothetical protein
VGSGSCPRYLRELKTPFPHDETPPSVLAAPASLGAAHPLGFQGAPAFSGDDGFYSQIRRKEVHDES